MIHNKLALDFYLNQPEYVAKNLLGKILVKHFNQYVLTARIVETEAYLSTNDEASHSFKGKTKRNSAMFEIGSTLYVYKIYGIHHCINVVTETEGIGSAVLIRAVEPINGIDIMKSNRNIENDELNNLTNGPAKLSQAMNFTLIDNNRSLLRDDLYIIDNNSIPETDIINTTRIGISKSQDLLLRFYINNNKFISRK